LVKVAVFNLPERELGEEKKRNEVARAITGAILSIPLTGLKEEDISLTFSQGFVERQGTVSVIITEALFFQERMNFGVRQDLCRMVKTALGPILRREGTRISVEIKKPK
jgi:hypothetical protein